MQVLLLAGQLLGQAFSLGQFSGQLLDLRLRGLGLILRRQLRGAGLGLLALQGLQLLGGAAQLGAQTLLHAFGVRAVRDEKLSPNHKTRACMTVLPAP